jgi:hypothetical protein
MIVNRSVCISRARKIEVSTRGNNDGHGPAGWSQPALSTRSDADRRDNLYHRDRTRSG